MATRRTLKSTLGLDPLAATDEIPQPRMMPGRSMLAQAFNYLEERDYRGRVDAARARAAADKEAKREADAQAKEAARLRAAQEKEARRARNTAIEEQAVRTGAKTWTDAYGDMRFVRDDEGRQLFNEDTGPIEYDPKTGRAIRVKRDQYGRREVIDLDKDAPIGPADEAPGIYRKNKFREWDYLSDADTAARSTDPRLRKAGIEAIQRRDKELLDRVSKAADAVAYDSKEKLTRAQIRRQEIDAETQRLAKQNEELSALPETGETEGGFLGIGKRPTARAKPNLDTIAANAERMKELAEEGFGLDSQIEAIGGEVKQSKAEMDAIKTGVRAKGYQTARDLRVAKLRAEGKGDDAIASDPIISSIDRAVKELAIPASPQYQEEQRLGQIERQAETAALEGDDTPTYDELLEMAGKHAAEAEGTRADIEAMDKEIERLGDEGLTDEANQLIAKRNEMSAQFNERGAKIRGLASGMKGLANRPLGGSIPLGEKDGGILTQIRLGADEGFKGIGKAGWGTLDMVWGLGAKIPILGKYYEYLGEKVGAKDISEFSANEVEGVSRIRQATEGPKFVGTVASGAMSIIPTLATAPLGFGAVVTAAGLQSVGSVFSDATEAGKRRGLTDDQARNAAIVPAVASGVSTALWTYLGGRTGPEAAASLLRDKAAGGIIQNAIKKTLGATLGTFAVNAGGEALEEGVDQLVQGIISQWSYDPEKSIGDVVSEALEAGAVGAILGGGFAGIEVHETRRRAKAQREAESEDLARRGITLDAYMRPGISERWHGDIGPTALQTTAAIRADIDRETAKLDSIAKRRDDLRVKEQAEGLTEDESAQLADLDEQVEAQGGIVDSLNQSARVQESLILANPAEVQGARDRLADAQKRRQDALDAHEVATKAGDKKAAQGASAALKQAINDGSKALADLHDGTSARVAALNEIEAIEDPVERKIAMALAKAGSGAPLTADDVSTLTTPTDKGGDAPAFEHNGVLVIRDVARQWLAQPDKAPNAASLIKNSENDMVRALNANPKGSTPAGQANQQAPTPPGQAAPRSAPPATAGVSPQTQAKTGPPKATKWATAPGSGPFKTFTPSLQGDKRATLENLLAQLPTDAAKIATLQNQKVDPREFGFWTQEQADAEKAANQVPVKKGTPSKSKTSAVQESKTTKPVKKESKSEPTKTSATSTGTKPATKPESKTSDTKDAPEPAKTPEVTPEDKKPEGMDVAEWSFRKYVKGQIEKKAPFKAAPAETYGVEIPAGWVKEDDRYVFRGEGATKATPPTTKSGETGSKSVESTKAKAPESKAPTNIAAQAVAQIEAVTGQKLTPEQAARVAAVIARIQKAATPYLPIFKAIGVTPEALGSGGLSMMGGALQIRIADIFTSPSQDMDGRVLNMENPTLLAIESSPDRVNRLVTEEAIHAIAVKVVSMKEAADIWNQLPESVRRDVRSAYTFPNASDGLLGHEFLRMVAQGKVFGGITEQTDRTLAKRIGDVFRRIVEFAVNLEGKLLKGGASKDVVKRIKAITDYAASVMDGLNAVARQAQAQAVSNEVIPELEIRVGKYRAPVESIEDAKAKWNQYRTKAMREGMSPDEIGRWGEIYQNGEHVARISWNGRAWNLDGAEITTPKSDTTPKKGSVQKEGSEVGTSPKPPVSSPTETAEKSERAITIKKILDEEERQRLDRIEPVKRTEELGDDGRWYGAGGHPINVRLTGETRSYWVRLSKREGTTHGKRFAAEDELLADIKQQSRGVRDEMEAELNRMDDAALQRQAEYWLGSKAPTAKEASPSKSPKPRRIGFSPPISERFRQIPVIASILNHGGIVSRGAFRKKQMSKAVKGRKGKDADAATKANSSMWDGAPTGQSPLAHPTHNQIFKTTGLMPDQMAQALFEDGVIAEPTPDAMWGAIFKASRDAKVNKASLTDEEAIDAAQDEYARKQLDQRKNLDDATKDGPVPISPQDLTEGSTLDIEGTRVTVESVETDDDGNVVSVTLKDGQRFGLQTIDGGRMIYVEGADIKPLGDFDPDTLASADLFSLESVTPDQVKAEEKAKAEKAVKDKQRQQMLDRANAPLVGDSSDVGQGDFFRDDLFGGKAVVSSAPIATDKYPSTMDPGSLDKSQFLSEDEYRNWFTEHYRREGAIQKARIVRKPDYGDGYRSLIYAADTIEEANEWRDMHPQRRETGYGWSAKDGEPPRRFFDPWTPISETPERTNDGKWGFYADEQVEFYTENEGANSRTVPMRPLPIRPGMWRISSLNGVYGHDIDQLLYVDPKKVIRSENLVEQNIEGRGWDADRYAKWLDEGKMPPPVEIVETDGGQLKVSNGHRRHTAHLKANKPMLAWVSFSMDSPSGLRRDGGKGPVSRVALTYEAVKGKSMTDVGADFLTKNNSTQPIASAPAISEHFASIAKSNPKRADAAMRAATRPDPLISVGLAGNLNSGGQDDYAAGRRAIYFVDGLMRGKFDPETAHDELAKSFWEMVGPESRGHISELAGDDILLYQDAVSDDDARRWLSSAIRDTMMMQESGRIPKGKDAIVVRAAQAFRTWINRIQKELAPLATDNMRSANVRKWYRQEGLASAPAVTPEQDRAYLAAVELGDTETAQRMVDEAARAAGYLGPWYHGGTAETRFGFKDESGPQYFYVTEDIDVASGWADQYEKNRGKILPLYIRANRILDLTDKSEFERHIGKLGDEMLSDRGNLGRASWVLRSGSKIIDRLFGEGFDAIKFYDTDARNRGAEVAMIVRESSQAKLADRRVGDTWWGKSVVDGTVTRDSSGNVIPLSQRFNPAKDSILYSAPASQPASPDTIRQMIGDIDADIATDEADREKALARRQKGDIEANRDIARIDRSLKRLRKRRAQYLAQLPDADHDNQNLQTPAEVEDGRRVPGMSAGNQTTPLTGKPNDPNRPIPPPMDFEDKDAATISGTFTRDPAPAQWLSHILEWMNGFKGTVPEIPVLGKDADKYRRLPIGLRDLRSATVAGRTDASRAVKHVIEPILALNIKPEQGLTAKLKAVEDKIAAIRQANKPVPESLIAERRAITAKMRENPYHLFREAVLYRDLWYRGHIDTGRKDPSGNPVMVMLPNGLTVEECAAKLEQIHAGINGHANREAIEEALRRHYQLISDTREDLIGRGYVITEEMVNPFYFPHTVLEKWNGYMPRTAIDTAEPFRGYLVRLVGTDGNIETDYLTAMFKHLTEVRVHNLGMDAVELHWRRPYDILAQLKGQASAEAARSGRRAGPNEWRRLVPPDYEILNPDHRLPLRPEAIIDREALERRLGVRFMEGDILKQIQDMGITLTAWDLEHALAAGNPTPWVVPKVVAKAIRNIIARESLEAPRSAHNPGGRKDNLGDVGMRAWKFWKLHSPTSAFRYNWNNVVTDLEKIITVDPKVFTYFPRAYREVRAWMKDGSGGPDVLAAARHDVFSTVTASEVSRLPEMPQFREFRETGEAIRDIAGRVVFWSKDFANFREATFRYAKFLADLERLRAGQTPVYGGAFWKNVEAEVTDEAKAAHIARETFVDYSAISVSGEYMRRKVAPFYSWIEGNWRYHVNLFRNGFDMASPANMESRAGTLARLGAVLPSKILLPRSIRGFALRMGMLQALVWAWNAYQRDRHDINDTDISDEDRRRLHIIVGKKANGKPELIYASTAINDLVRWFGGNEFVRLFGDVMSGRMGFDDAARQWARHMPKDFINNVAGSIRPEFRAGIAFFTRQNTWPDITNPRPISAKDMRRFIIAQVTDDFTANHIERLVNKDFYDPRDYGEWAKQLVLQVRQRDPDQWAYYEIRNLAEEFMEAKGVSGGGGYKENPDAQLIRSFRSAINEGDIDRAAEFYQRLLAGGYSQKRLEATLANMDPLDSIPKTKDGGAMRREFLASLSKHERDMLARSFRYYARVRGANPPQLFGTGTAPRKISDAEARAIVSADAARRKAEEPIRGTIGQGLFRKAMVGRSDPLDMEGIE